MEQQTSSRIEWAVRDNPDRRRFEIDLGDGSLAIAEYTLPEGMIMFTHTEVPPEHGGKGIGTVLIRAGLAAARERDLKVIPICPFSPPTSRSMPQSRISSMQPGGVSSGLPD